MRANIYKMLLRQACLCVQSRLILTTTRCGIISIILVLQVQWNIIPKLFQLVRGRAAIWTKSWLCVHNSHHVPLHLTVHVGGDFKAKYSTQNTDITVQTRDATGGCRPCSDPVCPFDARRCITCWPPPFSWNILPLGEGESLWLNYNKPLCSSPWKCLSSPILTWFFSQSFTAQGHSPLWWLCSKSFGRQEVYPNGKPPCWERAPPRWGGQTPVFFSHRREKQEINMVWCQRRDSDIWGLSLLTKGEKLKRNAKCEKKEEKEIKNKEEEKCVIHKDFLLKWVEGKVGGAIERRFIFLGNRSLRVILLPPPTVWWGGWRWGATRGEAPWTCQRHQVLNLLSGPVRVHLSPGARKMHYPLFTDKQLESLRQTTSPRSYRYLMLDLGF